MKNVLKRVLVLFFVMMTVGATTLPVWAEEKAPVTSGAEAEAETEESVKGTKAMAAAIAIAVAAAAGAIAMGISIAKSSEAIARQPEAAGNIRTGLMLGLVFVETAIIYALIVAILIIFVL